MTDMRAKALSNVRWKSVFHIELVPDLSHIALESFIIDVMNNIRGIYLGLAIWRHTQTWFPMYYLQFSTRPAIT